MKYLFINAVAGSGSTGRIAAQQCRELEAQGHECVLAYGRGRAACGGIETYRIGTAWDCRLHGLYTRISDRHGFGSAAATKRFLEWADGYGPDVIWLHNIHGYYINIELLFGYIKEKKIKTYWTLHDCWSFTGHCAYFSYVKCGKWKEGCGGCPQKGRYPKSFLLDNSRGNFERKRKAFCGVEDMTLVTPSQWLADLVKESFLKEYKTEVVHNKIDTDIFKPTPSDFRERYGLEGKRVILGVANVWEERKGLNDFIKLAGMLDERYAVVLVGLSRKQMKGLPKNVAGLPKTESAGQLAEIYTAADIFVNLSHEENYPTVCLEAQACGTAVIAYDAGGTGETFGNNGSSCRAVPTGDLEEICRCIEQYFRKERAREN